MKTISLKGEWQYDLGYRIKVTSQGTITANTRHICSVIFLQ
jgi:hypothetical protein